MIVRTLDRRAGGSRWSEVRPNRRPSALSLVRSHVLLSRWTCNDRTGGAIQRTVGTATSGSRAPCPCHGSSAAALAIRQGVTCGCRAVRKAARHAGTRHRTGQVPRSPDDRNNGAVLAHCLKLANCGPLLLLACSALATLAALTLSIALTYDRLIRRQHGSSADSSASFSRSLAAGVLASNDRSRGPPMSGYGR